MYDQFEAETENDFIAALRRSGGDAYAIATMRNHWAGYYPEAALDAMAAFGVTHTRIAVGYWITEAPVGARSFREYGFNHEGFVTGGINELEGVLRKLKARGIASLIDLHAVPGGGSKCASYSGLSVPEPLFWTGTPPPNASVPIAACNGAGPYYSSRGDAGGGTWMDAGLAALDTLAAWIVGLEGDPTTAGAVFGLELVNEPGLGFPNMSGPIRHFFARAVPRAQRALAAGAPDVAVVLNFITPNEDGAGAWVAQQIESGAFAGLLVDYHNYYNWAGNLTWPGLEREICAPASGAHGWAQYSAAGLPVLVGEWAAASNLDAPAYNNVSDAGIRGHLRTDVANQVSMMASTPGVWGQTYWSARMGSGWDPRPTTSAPSGTQVRGVGTCRLQTNIGGCAAPRAAPTQVPGTAWDTSLESFGPRDWNLGEMIRLNVAVRARVVYQ